jgi:hypothetical protein
MGMADWFNSKQREMDSAYREAAELRDRYGDEAMTWCQAGLLSAQDADKRRALKQIRKVLLQLPRSGAPM